jgi:hypothetical protein
MQNIMDIFLIEHGGVMADKNEEPRGKKHPRKRN